jgi:uncharacterized protein YehS (DUF1456 family)
MTSEIDKIRMTTSMANEVIDSLSKNTSEEAASLLSLTIQGLNLLHKGKNGKVRLENQYAYFDADFLDSKVWVNIRLKEEFWHTVVNLQQLNITLGEMGYNEENKIEKIAFDNRIHLFIPYRKPIIGLPTL